MGTSPFYNVDVRDQTKVIRIMQQMFLSTEPFT